MWPREDLDAARVQAKKIDKKILESAFFELHKHYAPHKKAENIRGKISKTAVAEVAR